ncbi:hypothetical protein CDAR_101101 [Caerostris darwini]|uniref:Uncharacterized protein n=1 Tax=Caerostris darwini TaxID=1538125 RepID=A0AAV4QCF5_9ARAC|nr:hypothetical protein CDAR_101101 [Caerostris darwini]
MSSWVERTLSKVVEAEDGQKLIHPKHMVDMADLDTSRRQKEKFFNNLTPEDIPPEKSFSSHFRNVITSFDNLWIGSNWLFPRKVSSFGAMTRKASVVNVTSSKPHISPMHAKNTSSIGRQDEYISLREEFLGVIVPTFAS